MSYTRAFLSRGVVRVVPLLLLVLLAAALSTDSRVVHASATADGVAGQTVAGPQGQEDGSDPEAKLPFLFAVFFITWVVFFAYVFYMSRRQRDMQREIEALKRVLTEQERDAVPAESRSESGGS